MAAGGLSPAAAGAVDCVFHIARRVGSPSARGMATTPGAVGPGSHCLQTVGNGRRPRRRTGAVVLCPTERAALRPGRGTGACKRGGQGGRSCRRGTRRVRRSGRCLRYRRRNGEFGSVLVALTDRRAKKILAGCAIVLTRLEAPAVQADEAGRARRAGAAVEAAGGVRLLPERHAGPLGAAAERAAGGRAATAVAGAARPGRAAHPGAVGGGAGAGAQRPLLRPPLFLALRRAAVARLLALLAGRRTLAGFRHVPPDQRGNRAGEQSPNQSAPVGTERDGQRIEAVCILVDTPFPYMRSRGFGRMSSDVQCGRCRFGAGTVTRSSQVAQGVAHTPNGAGRRPATPARLLDKSTHTSPGSHSAALAHWLAGGQLPSRGCRQSPSGAPERKCTGSARCRRRRLAGRHPRTRRFPPGRWTWCGRFPARRYRRRRSTGPR